MKQLNMNLKRFFVISAISFLVTLLGDASATASTNCRQVARDVQSDGAVATTSDPSGQASVKVFTDAVAAYPECNAELEALWDWNQARDPNSPFPFAKSGDPKNYPLGPISWWWDVIYNDLFGGNVLLMFLFGWELFLAPFPIIFILILFPIRLVSELFKRKRD